jgi:hypothetical protein
MTALEHNFHLWATSGICDLCGNHTSVISDVMTMQRRCLPCIMKERLALEEKQRERNKIPLDMEDFCK